MVCRARSRCALTPKDPELRFNLAAVLEASDKLDEALRCAVHAGAMLTSSEYTAAKDMGVERAAIGIRNVGGKVRWHCVDDRSLFRSSDGVSKPSPILLDVSALLTRNSVCLCEARRGRVA